MAVELHPENFENLENNKNYDLDMIKLIMRSKIFNDTSANLYPNVALLWNIRTINDNKLRKLIEIINYLIGNEKVRMDKQNREARMIGVDFLVITEFGKKESKFNPFNMPGYKLFTALRIDKKGGGVGIYVKNCHTAHVKYKEITNDYEFLLIEIWKDVGLRIYVLGIYRPPSGDKTSFFMKLEEILLKHDESLIIMGDTNINSNEKSCTSFKQFEDILECFNYRIINSLPTRFNFITSNHSTIDQIITRDSIKEVVTLTSNEKVIEGISDHNLLMYIQPGLSYRKNTSKSISTTRVNKQKLVNSLKQQIPKVPININPEIYCKDLLEKVEEMKTINSMKITLKTKEDLRVIPDWMDSHFISLSNAAFNMRNKISSLTSQSRPTSLLRARLLELEKEKDEYAYKRALWFYNDRINSNTNEMWKVLNEMSGTVKSKPNFKLNVNGMITSEEQKVADCFQSYFLSIVGTKIQHDVSEISYIPSTKLANKFSFKCVDEDKINMLLRNLDAGKASGIDGISPFIWKQLQNEAAKPIQILFNSMIDKSTFPKPLKRTIIIPIHKSGVEYESANYRPVSIPISLNKILEREMYDQIEEYLKSSELLDVYQYGFTKGKGCSDIIGKVIAETSKAVEKGKIVILISLDLSKAFDKLDHDLLINKLRDIGFDKRSLDLMKDYLSDRSQQVKIGDKLSFIGIILSGVPQGTNLGPLLFSIFINDMKYLPTHSRIFKFADDNLLLFEIDPSNNGAVNYEELLKADLQMINDYFERNKLVLNLQKSQALIIGKKDPKGIKEVLSEYQIEIKEEMKYLGVVLDAELKFNTHSHAIKKKINQAIGAVSVMRNKLMLRPLLNFYFANFQSHLMYSTFLLIRLPSYELKKLQISQNRILKLIYKLPTLTSTSDLYTNIAPTVLPIMGIIFYAICMMVHKSLQTSDASLIKVEMLRSIRVNMLKIERSSLTIRSNDTEIIGPSIYNSLPQELRSINSIPLFKRRLKQFLLSKNGSLSADVQISTKNKIL